MLNLNSWQEKSTFDIKTPSIRPGEIPEGMQGQQRLFQTIHCKNISVSLISLFTTQLESKASTAKLEYM